jgi:KUP system potassium uptake protein
MLMKIAQASPAKPPRHADHSPKGNLAPLTLAALGVVFGDIGTSPLYTIGACVNADKGIAMTRENVLGILSLIVYALIVVVAIKYLGFIMKADNEGEGGILALLALVPDSMRASSKGTVGWVTVVVLIGTALLYGDGIITPSISVLSAVEGLGVVTSTLKPFVLPITCALLIALFAVQSRGTGSVGVFFGPVMIIWFSTLFVLGVHEIIQMPEILTALWPAHAIGYFARNGWRGFAVLGGVVLAVTGGEALYADMGHFGRRPIRIAWWGLVMPALVVNYFGQGALVLRHPETLDPSPFFAMVPHGIWTVALVILSSLATVIASQALITGAFSLTHQAVQLGYFPRVEVRHTSSEAEGQIYVPLVNSALMIACVVLVLAFKESSKLAAAYGIAVTGTMGMTSLVYFVVTRRTWGWPMWKSLPLLILFLSFDLPFFSANLLKFLDGGYVPMLVGLNVFIVMIVWRRGRYLLSEHIQETSPEMGEFIASLDGKLLGRLPQIGVFLCSNVSRAPTSLRHHAERIRVLPETVILLTIKSEHVPVVPQKDAVQVTDLGRGFYKVVARNGFIERPNVPAIVKQVLTSERLPHGKDHPITYYIGREHIISGGSGRMRGWTEQLFAFLSRNAQAATTYFGIPREQVVEIGTQIDL